jgi:hypothetical protein
MTFLRRDTTPASVQHGDFRLHRSTVTLRSEHCLTIDCPPGCSLRVLFGRAWITVDGVLRDVVAGPGNTVPLQAGAVTRVSALYRTVTFVIAAGSRSRDAAFTLQMRNGAAVLHIGTTGGRLQQLLADIRAGLPALVPAPGPAGS